MYCHFYDSVEVNSEWSGSFELNKKNHTKVLTPIISKHILVDFFCVKVSIYTIQFLSFGVFLLKYFITIYSGRKKNGLYLWIYKMYNMCNTYINHIIYNLAGFKSIDH